MRLPYGGCAKGLVDTTVWLKEGCGNRIRLGGSINALDCQAGAAAAGI